MERLVFIIDDDPVYLKFMQKHFGMLDGFRTKIFATGQEAMLAMHEDPFLVVIDHHLNEKGKVGLDYLKPIRKIAPHAAILYMSGDTDPVVGEKARAAGADDFIAKDAGFLVRLRTFLDRLGSKPVTRSFLKALFKYK